MALDMIGSRTADNGANRRLVLRSARTAPPVPWKPAFGDLCVRAAGEVWGKPHLSQRTKAFLTIAIDVVNQGLNGPGSPFEAHIRMAIKQGATYEEIEELLLFTCIYAGFNKAAFAFGRWAEIRASLEAS